MSDTTTPAPTPRRGNVVISVIAQATFLVALVAAGYLYWVTKDPVVLAVLSAQIGVAATNATNVVGYWIGSSAGSDKKTDMIAGQKP